MKFSIPGRPAVQGEGWVRAEGDPLPHPVSIRVALDADGRLVATGLLIEADRELAARDLRFPLAAVVAGLASATSKRRTLHRLARERFAAFNIEFVDEGEDSSESVHQSWRWLLPLAGRRRIPQRTRSHEHDKNFYNDVAAAYKQAKREHPQEPIRALMKALNYSEAQTHRHLRAAEACGSLPPRPKRGRRSAAEKED